LEEPAVPYRSGILRVKGKRDIRLHVFLHLEE